MRYFIGNWKMFGTPNSIVIVNKINNFLKKDKNKKKYRVIITPPFTLLESFAKILKNKKISIGSQNCYHKDYFSSNTGAISPYMIKKLNVGYTIIGHSDNRSEGDNDSMLKDKVKYALKNKLKVIFCIGETLSEKRKKKTKSILSKQIKIGLNKIKNKSNIFIAYEPVWAIGTGIIPKSKDLYETVNYIKSKFKGKPPRVLYGGSVNPNNIKNLKEVSNIDGFLIGGASQNANKFIDIVKKTYS